MTRRILIILTEMGYWGEELIGPLEAFDQAGYAVAFATPNGKRPQALPDSMDPTYVDPPLGRPVVSADMAEKVKAIEGTNRLDNPINLRELMPDRPYHSSVNFLREQEGYFRALERAREDLDRRYDTMLIVGGSGALVDLANNFRVHDLVLSFLQLGKPIAAECYGVSCLAFARDTEDRCSITPAST